MRGEGGEGAVDEGGADACWWRWWSVDGERLTFKTRSLAEVERRILSHQAGHLVLMYCFPWLLSSLYG